MSMATSVKGLRSPNGKRHQLMRAAVEALHNAEIYDMPEELQKYFSATETGEITANPYAGCEVDIRAAVEDCTEVREVCKDYIVELALLPEGVTHIRFTNSY